MRKRKVLVVEDQKLNRAVLKEILESEYDVLYAVNGKEALDIMNREGRHLSLVLLDIVMPVMDGYEVLKAMERRKLLEQIPVLVASQRFGDDSELQALLLGAGDYVSKPYNPAVLKRRIKNQIRMHEALMQVTVLEKDPVTGLYNKVSFNNRAVNIFEKYSEKKFDVIVIDIEHFKLYNSYYGFAEGDKLLRHIAEKLIELLFDKVSLCAREYGDRFLIICERKKDYFPKLYEGLTKDMEQYPSDIKIHLKFGVYEITDYTMEVTGMCDLAVCAMKRGKGVYDRNVVYYDESIEDELFWEQQITDDMEPALHNGEFQVYLQPKYDIFTEKMAGAEALVRWVHPVKGIIPPDKFIPIFEKNGFITELDMYVWDKTCELINEWIREDNKYVPVSVNVSRKDIYRQNLPEVFIKEISSETEVSAHRDYGKCIYGRSGTADQSSESVERSRIYHRDGRFWNRIFFPEYAGKTSDRYPETGYEDYTELRAAERNQKHYKLYYGASKMDESVCSGRRCGDEGTARTFKEYGL